MLFKLLESLLLAEDGLSAGLFRVSRVLFFIRLSRQHIRLLNLDPIVKLRFLLFVSPLPALELFHEDAVALVLQVVAIIHVVEGHNEY